MGVQNAQKKARGTTESFIGKAIIIHGEFYDCSKVNYKSLDEDVIIICPKHGEFSLKPRAHIHGGTNGCALCKRSKGEIAIREWLLKNNIEFEEQKMFKSAGLKRFDFYIKDLNLCIEFDGAQHFHVRHQKTRDKEKAARRFEDIQRRDREKDEFCIKSDIKLLRISYRNLSKINKILENEIIHNTTSR